MEVDEEEDDGMNGDCRKKGKQDSGWVRDGRVDIVERFAALYVLLYLLSQDIRSAVSQTYYPETLLLY